MSTMLLGFLTATNVVLVVLTLVGVFSPVREEREEKGSAVPTPLADSKTETVEYAPGEQGSLIHEDLGYVVSLYSSTGYVSGVLCNSHEEKSSAFGVLSTVAQQKGKREPGYHCGTMRLLSNGLCELCNAELTAALTTGVKPSLLAIGQLELCPCG